MYVERILCPITTLGPGKRLVLWVNGCSKKCAGCISPEMQVRSSKKYINNDDLLKIINNIFIQEPFSGITISGGDPFEQLDDLMYCLKFLKQICNDILVYTGFTWNDYIKELDENSTKELKELISVLIDGPYIEELNVPSCSLRGSKNQKIYFFDKSLEKEYRNYIKKPRELQNIYVGNKLITIGIMNKADRE